jgi:hypothetical protein
MVTGRTIRVFAIAVGLLSIVSMERAGAEDPSPSQELLNRMKAMEQRIQMLEQQLEQKNAPASPASPAATAGAPASATPASGVAPQPMVQAAPTATPAAINKDLFGLFPSPVDGPSSSL